jgi:hypothetical protein
MNGPVPTGIWSALITASPPGQAGGGSLELSLEGMEGVEFSELLSGEKLLPELMEMLRSRLAPEDFARLEEMVESGNELPLPAILGLFQEILESNPALSPAASSEAADDLVPGSQANAQLARLVQLAKALPREGSSLSEGSGSSAAKTVLSQEEQATLKEILRQMLPARPEMAPGDQASAAIRPVAGTGAGAETVLTTVANLEAGISNMAQSPAIGVISNVPPTSQAMANPAPPILPAITVPPGDKGWDQAMGERILWMVGRDLQAASVNIKPPNLGPLHIQISIQNEQATVNFTAQHGVVKEALEAAVPRLREMLAENNIQLVNVDVSQREGSGRGEAADTHRERREGNDGPLAFHDGVESETDESVRYYRSDRLLDDYA